MKDADPDDGALRRYLLGELQEAEEEEIENLLLADDALFERCEAVEGDLLVDLEQGRLDRPQRKRVEAWLKASAEMRHRHEVIRRLRTIPVPALDAKEPEAPAGGGVVVPLRPRSRSSSQWIAWAALAAALFLAAGWAWFGQRETNAPPPEMAHETPSTSPRPETTPPPPLTSTPSTEHAQTKPEIPPSQRGPSEREELKSLGYLAPAVAATILEIPLDVRRDAASELPAYQVPSEATRVTLRFLFDLAPETQRYRLRIADDQGREVGRWNELKVKSSRQDSALTVNLPAEKLPPGRYWVGADPIDPGLDDLPVEILFEIQRPKG